MCCVGVGIKRGLHLHVNGTQIWMTLADESWGRMYGTFVHSSVFAETANRLYINVLYANSLWCTDSRRIAFGCSPNVRRTAECCSPRLGNTSTLSIFFECCVRHLFAFRCKPRFKVLTTNCMKQKDNISVEQLNLSLKTSGTLQSISIYREWWIIISKVNTGFRRFHYPQ